MKKYILIFVTTLSFIACGGGSAGSSSTSSSPLTTDTSSLKLALNNTGTVIEEEFNGYIVKIISSIILEELNETSQSTIALYGSINGSATTSLLKINTNYIGSDIYVTVFKDEVLVAQSEVFTVSNDNAINFGELTVK